MDHPYHQCNKVLYGDQAWCRCGHCYRPPRFPTLGYSHGFPPVPTQPPSFPRSTFTAQGQSVGWPSYHASQSYRQSWHGNAQNLQVPNRADHFDPSIHRESLRQAPAFGQIQSNQGWQQRNQHPQQVSFNASRLLNGSSTVDSYRPVYSMSPPRQSYLAQSAQRGARPPPRRPDVVSKFPEPLRNAVPRQIQCPAPRTLPSQPASLNTISQHETATSGPRELNDVNATKSEDEGNPMLSRREQLQADRAIVGVSHTANRKE